MRNKDIVLNWSDFNVRTRVAEKVACFEFLVGTQKNVKMTHRLTQFVSHSTATLSVPNKISRVNIFEYPLNLTGSWQTHGYT